jgi:hypothetical protein
LCAHATVLEETYLAGNTLSSATTLRTLIWALLAITGAGFVKVTNWAAVRSLTNSIQLNESFSTVLASWVACGSIFATNATFRT